ncbi:MAG TPA: 16S rRNA (cytosine(1402)-N(4))-methyltransferase RsmH [Gemmatimonadaceae bacterium]
MSAPSPGVDGSNWDSAYHAPVLAREVVDLLGASHSVLDGTLGGGGHALALLEAGVEHLTGVDRDPDALESVKNRLAPFASNGRFEAHIGNYAEIGQIGELAGVRFDGVLLDLGISSHQIDDPSRGFTFREDAPLDMRMDRGENEDTPTAADVLNSFDEHALASIFREYGDEHRAHRLAREVVRRRTNREFAVSDDLVGAIRGALGARTGPADFARLFQALRIAVNDELTGLERALPVLRDRLLPGGVMAVIAYHSGEDRLVKHAFREWSSDCVCPPKHPICTCRGRALGELIGRKATTPAPDELARNARSRSARLRAFRRSADA